MKVHHRMISDLDLDQLVVDFAKKHPRRMALPILVLENKIISILLSYNKMLKWVELN